MQKRTRRGDELIKHMGKALQEGRPEPTGTEGAPDTAQEPRPLAPPWHEDSRGQGDTTEWREDPAKRPHTSGRRTRKAQQEARSLGETSRAEDREQAEKAVGGAAAIGEDLGKQSHAGKGQPLGVHAGLLSKGSGATTGSNNSLGLKTPTSSNRKGGGEHTAKVMCSRSLGPIGAE